MPLFYSPLRYPGGKTSLISFLGKIIERNSPIETYIEPFAGGAGAAMGLLLNNYVERIILNDYDEFIYKFWLAVLNNKDELIFRIKETPVNLETYYLQKEVLSDEKRVSATITDIGFAAFYLNRCNRSGILRSGPIGGHDQTGKWKINARFNKEDLISRIERIYEVRDRISFYNQDAVEFLRNQLPTIGINNDKVLIYLDPPYYEYGSTLYRIYYRKSEHKILNDYLLNEIDFKWVLSYDDVPQINELYEGIRINGYKKSHFIYKAKVGKELIIVSDNCILPAKDEQKRKRRKSWE